MARTSDTRDVAAWVAAEAACPRNKLSEIAVGAHIQGRKRCRKGVECVAWSPESIPWSLASNDSSWVGLSRKHADVVELAPPSW